MKVLLAIDDSACSEAAMQAVIRQFQPQDTEVRVLHVAEWPKGLPTSLAFAEDRQLRPTSWNYVRKPAVRARN